MMRWVRKKEGFTLIELLIVILTGTIVTAAATTILLLAFRINRKTLDTAERQSVTRIVMSVLENMNSDEEYILVPNAKEDKNGNISLIGPEEGAQPLKSWSINIEGENGASGNAIIQYVPPIGLEKGSIQAGGQPLLGDISNSLLYRNYSRFDYVRDLYTFSVEIDGEEYNSTLYSRTQEEDWRANDPLIDFDDGRNALVNIASSQVGTANNGQIIKPIAGATTSRLSQWYTEWYVKNYVDINPDKTVFDYSDNAASQEGDIANGVTWNKKTPWCATFVSWVLKQGTNVDIGATNTVAYLYDDSSKLEKTLPQDANVNFLWMKCFAYTDASHMKVNSSTEYSEPKPGDLVFFEFTGEPEDSKDASGQVIQNLTGIKFTDQDNSLREAIDRAIKWEKTGCLVNAKLHEDKKYTHDDYLITYKAWTELSDEKKKEYEFFSVMRHFFGCIGDGLDHVGIVVKVEKRIEDGNEKTYIYTVEGNVGVDETDVNKMTRIRRYVKEDSRIFGYATLNWIP